MTEKPMFTPESGILTNEQFLTKIAESDFPVAISNKNIVYYNIPAAFDIEVSSFYERGEKRAVMYHWQFGILNWVTAGRTWDSYIRFMRVLSTILGLNNDRRLVVYIHNFSYEFQFMRKRFEWDKLFFLEERKPVYALTNGVEYRCSLKLSSKSLQKVGEDLQKYKVKKMVGDLDYQMLRTPKTPLSPTELGYCENDIRVILAYIMEKIETDGDITMIPLTNTGYVRNYCRKACFRKYKKYRGLMAELTLDPDEYKQLKRGFCGGFTHASAKYSGKIMEHVGSFDFTSSYPAVMLSEKFPMSRSKLISEIKDTEELKYYLSHYCCLFDVTFIGLIPKVNYDHPISYSKLINSFGVLTDNGRVVSAESVSLTCTEQDFYVYSEFYQWESMTIKKFRIYEKGYLPRDFVKAILKMYKDKTTLKGVAGEEINYMISKNMLNSAYGMAVTDIVRDEITYEYDEFSSTKPDLDKAIDDYNSSKRRFLFYPWGVWVTAYARANLFSGILECKDDYIYSDTDSIKVLHVRNHAEYINRYNDQIMEKLRRAAEFHGISPDEFSPLNRKGVAKPIGVWDYEGEYDRFKTIGAKRYITEKNGEYSLTVAGVNKTKARDYIVSHFDEPMDALADHLVVPKEYSGRLTVTYCDEPYSTVVKDYLGEYCEVSEESYIHMEPSEYELTMSDEYKAFLNKIFNVRDDSW